VSAKFSAVHFFNANAANERIPKYDVTRIFNSIRKIRFGVSPWSSPPGQATERRSYFANGLENRNDVTQPRRGDLILAGEQFVHNPKGVTFSVESFHPLGIMFRAPPPLPSCHPFGIETLANLFIEQSNRLNSA
jgi:hypothetical protein